MNQHKLYRLFVFIFLLWTPFHAAWAAPCCDKQVFKMIEHVIESIEKGEQHISNLPYGASGIPGMTGTSYRHFLNNLCSLPDTSYLEIGCWKGSTLIASLCGNKETVKYAVAIDTFGTFGGPKKMFYRNVGAYLRHYPLHFYEMDAFEMDLEAHFPYPITVYFYDGDHSAEAQEQAFTYFDPVFANTFIAVVDDWNFESVREGTEAALQKLGYRILFQKEIFTNPELEPDGWWNGVYIAVLQKAPCKNQSPSSMPADALPPPTF